MRVRVPALSYPRTDILSQTPVHGHPRGRLGETSTPTRSARTPLVMRPRHRRVETPTVPGAAPVRACALDDLTTRAPPRRVGAREPRTRRTSATTLARGPPCTDASQGQGSHLPSFREEERDPPHPRCLPSVNPATGDPDETLSGPILDIGGRGEPYLYPGMVLSTACCQPGDNAQRSFQAHCIRSP